MKLIKELRIVLFIAGIIGILVFVKVLSKGDFSGTADTSTEAMNNRTNLITPAQLIAAGEKTVILSLGNVSTIPELNQFQVLNIPFENLTDKAMIKKLKGIDAKLIIWSSDLSAASKAWVILDQMKIRNLFILDQGNDEELKYKFRPDS
jgi:hypothetical protein